jgi:hypothetical protein
VAAGTTQRFPPFYRLERLHCEFAGFSAAIGGAVTHCDNLGCRRRSASGLRLHCGELRFWPGCLRPVGALEAWQVLMRRGVRSFAPAVVALSERRQARGALKSHRWCDFQRLATPGGVKARQ